MKTFIKTRNKNNPKAVKIWEEDLEWLNNKYDSGKKQFGYVVKNNI